jgi:hypothetical protein
MNTSARRPSKGIAFTNWLVSRTTRALERGTSRRGFLIGSAMVGSAVAVGVAVDWAARPGSAYTYITNCASGLCTDGYTEFCCALTNGINTCPPDSFPGGWWRADSSSFCGGGTRYYIDCMQYCCGPPKNYCQGGYCFCESCQECRCAGDCNTRRVYCNYFRYGQCHQEIPTSGPIACRVVSCVPPYTIAEYLCSTAPAVDNSTAEHAPNCSANIDPPTVPVAGVLPMTGAAVSSASGLVSVYVRGTDAHVWYRDFNGTWGPWSGIGGAATSGIAVATVGTGAILAVRGIDNRAIWVNNRIGSTWTGWTSLGGVSRSDPIVVTDPTGVWLFVRGGDDALYGNRFDGSGWSGWIGFGGRITSEPVGVYDAPSTNTHVVARGSDNRVYARRFTAAGPVTDWVAMGGVAASDPTVVSDAAGVLAFVRGLDLKLYGNRWIAGGGWTGWGSLGGLASSDPVAVADPTSTLVFVRGGDNAVWYNRLVGGLPLGWQPLQGCITADPIAALATPTLAYVFVAGLDHALWYGTFTSGTWSGWLPLSGALVPARAGE